MTDAGTNFEPIATKIFDFFLEREVIRIQRLRTVLTEDSVVKLLTYKKNELSNKINKLAMAMKKNEEVENGG